jgi:hypothetical protein
MSEMTSLYSANLLPPPAVEPDAGFSLSLRLYAKYEQVVDFKLAGVAVLGLDERPPLGNGWGPSPAHLVGAALGACLGNGLLSWLRGLGVEVEDMRTDVTGSFARGADGQSRIGRISVQLVPILRSTPPAAMISPTELLRRSVVARTVSPGIDVRLSIAPEVQSPPLRVVHADRLPTPTVAAPMRETGEGPLGARIT